MAQTRHHCRNGRHGPDYPHRRTFTRQLPELRVLGEASAPGQLSLDEMLNEYKFRRVKQSTNLIGILGMPVGHSQSHLLHNRAFETCNLDFAYMKFPANDVNDFFENARPCGIRGFSVTIPYKISVIPCLDRIAPEASKIGAVQYRLRYRGWLGRGTTPTCTAFAQPSARRIQFNRKKDRHYGTRRRRKGCRSRS